MRNRIFISALALLVCMCGFLAGADASKNAEHFTVNGLKVIVKPNPANQIISAQLYLRGGALNLNEANQGIEELIFNAALKGSKAYPKDDLNQLLDKTAAQIFTSSNNDFTAVSLRCVNRYFDDVWNLFADVVINPTFDPEEVELVREQLLTNVRQREDNPDVYLRDMANQLFYAGHPYRLHTQGTEETLSQITIEQMRDYLKKNLVTSKLLLVVVGDIDKNDLSKKVKQAFGSLPQGNYTPTFPEMMNHSSANLITEERELPTNYIIGLFSAPSPKHPDFYPLTMATNILRTRVWEEVRTKRNLSYAPSAFSSTNFSNSGGIYVTAVDPDTTIKVMFAELKKMQEEPVSEKDLHDRVTMYLTRYYLNNETNAAQGQFLAMFELSGLGYEKSNEMVDNFRKVTADDIQRIAKKYFHNLQFAVLGNPQLIDRELFTSM